MKVLLDLNVVLDVLLNRAPWVAEASGVWDAHREGRTSAQLAAFALPTIFYIVRKQSNLVKAHESIRVCLETLEQLVWGSGGGRTRIRRPGWKRGQVANWGARIASNLFEIECE